MTHGIPHTGLIGAEQALTGARSGAFQNIRRGTAGALGLIRAAGDLGLENLEDITGQAVGQIQPFAQAGQGAAGQLSALLGAAGPQAQAQAFSQFQDDPGTQFLRERGTRGALNALAATGQIGSGNLLTELSRFNQGLANQSLSQRISQLSDLSRTGLQAGTTQAGLLGQRGALSTDLIGGLAGQGANILEREGLTGADIDLNVGSQLAGGRTRAGEQIAAGIGRTRSALADLAERQASGISGIVGQQTGNLANLLVGAGQGQTQGLQQLATLLANISTGQGSQAGALPGIPGIQQTEGILGQLGRTAAAAASLASDKNLKENITEVGSLNNGIKLYTWDWQDTVDENIKSQPTFGVIAQEVMKIIPDAVIEHEDGYLMVDYARLQ